MMTRENEVRTNCGLKHWIASSRLRSLSRKTGWKDNVERDMVQATLNLGTQSVCIVYSCVNHIPSQQQF